MIGEGGVEVAAGDTGAGKGGEGAGCGPKEEAADRLGSGAKVAADRSEYELVLEFETAVWAGIGDWSMRRGCLVGGGLYEGRGGGLIGAEYGGFG
jgi:hypothetical protein